MRAPCGAGTTAGRLSWRSELRLCHDPTDADLIVDLSNVCSQPVLGQGPPVTLERLKSATEVFGASEGLEDVAVFAVADESLIPRLGDPQEKRQLRQLVQDGLVEMLPGADERILELVALTGLPAMSWDGFGGHRDVFPWIQGDTDHFVKIVEKPRGTLALERREMGVLLERDVSQRAEIDALKAAHLLTARGEPDATVLGRWWRCTDKRCSLFGDKRTQGQPVPLRARGQVLCSLHRTPLTDAGERPAQVQVVLQLNGKAVGRLTITAGQEPTVLGRVAGPSQFDLTTLAPEQALTSVSRQHLALQLVGTDLLVTDLGTTNGTERVNGKDGTVTALLPHEPRPLAPRDRLRLPDALELRMSGRRFPAWTHEVGPSGPSAAQPPGTVLDGRL